MERVTPYPHLMRPPEYSAIRQYHKDSSLVIRKVIFDVTLKITTHEPPETKTSGNSMVSVGHNLHLPERTNHRGESSVKIFVSQVTKHNSSLCSNSAKCSRPRLACRKATWLRLHTSLAHEAVHVLCARVTSRGIEPRFKP